MNHKYLICVQTKDLDTNKESNNNKFYEMIENDNGTFTSFYGRIGSKPARRNYDMSKWHQKFYEKTTRVRNGYIYKDITHLKQMPNIKTQGFVDIKDDKLQSILNTLQSYSSKSIKDNYTIASEAVTQPQVDEAQREIDFISNALTYNGYNQKTYDDINKHLIELFQIIPRKMKYVQDFLIYNDCKTDNVKRIISREQDTLDVMAGQVNVITPNNSDEKIKLAEALNIRLNHIEDEDKINILKLMGNNSNQFVNAWIVDNTNTNPKFKQHKETNSVKPWTKLLWHGSRNENWLNILKTGLLIRPSGVVFTGAMFGNGIYFADKAQKSIGYTSLNGSYWARGNDCKAFLAIYAVNTGMELRQSTHEHWMSSLTEQKLRDRGEYDSLFAVSGNSLRNNEFIVYNKNQCTIKYLVEISK